MIEVRREGGAAVVLPSIQAAWAFIDEGFEGKDQMFWSVESVAVDMTAGGWMSCCRDADQFSAYLDLLGVEL